MDSLPSGETPPAFVERVRRLIWGAESGPEVTSSPQTAIPNPSHRAPPAAAKSIGPRVVGIALVVAGLAAAAYVVSGRLGSPRHAALETAASASVRNAPATDGAAAEAFSPPPHSVAVLPFVNVSGDPKQDYFSDGLSEELLNALASVRDLRVAARTSSFYFKGDKIDLAKVAHKLNVGTVLEGSVRKDGTHVRISAQLINTTTGYQLWAQSFDRDLKDVLKLQSDIAADVTRAMQATLLADAVAAIEVGGTHDPRAFDAFLRARAAVNGSVSRAVSLAVIAGYDEATRLDPQFARAYSAKSNAETGFAEYYGVGAEIREHFARARASAERALALAPNLGSAHAAYANVLSHGYFEFRGALAEYERAVQLSPNDAAVLLPAGWFFTDIGRVDRGVSLGQQGIALDQLNPRSYRSLALIYNDARRYPETIQAADRSLSLNPRDSRQAALRGEAQAHLGQFDAARQSCETTPLDWENRLCLAVVLHKLNRHADAEAQRVALEADLGDASAYQYAEIYAQWGDVPMALQWLEKAYRLRDAGLSGMKVDEWLDPLRQEPRYQYVLRQMKFPD